MAAKVESLGVRYPRAMVTRRHTGGRTAYRFAHERVHRYLVARYLKRQDAKPLEGWHADIRKGLGRKHWDDALEFWGEMTAEAAPHTKSGAVGYRKFLQEAAAFEHTIFAERLYPQYERLRDAGKIEADAMLERWAANRLAKFVARAV